MPVAGAIADQKVLDRITKKKLDLNGALERNESFTFCKKLGNQVVTGVTGANVSDLMVVLRDRQR